MRACEMAGGLSVDTPVHSGPSAGSLVDLDPMLAEFYTLMGWTLAVIPVTRRWPLWGSCERSR